jgi:nicotinamide-nucleotide amidase
MSDLRTAAIIAVGSELLTPHRVDTNSLFLAGRLNDIGIRVRCKYVVGDSPDDLSAVLRAALARADLVMPAINRRQARAPEGAVVLPNERGTAPGLLLRIDRHLLVLLPGPPHELRPMFDEQVAPRLAGGTVGRPLRRRTLGIAGRSESQVEEVAFPVYSRLATSAVQVETTILASAGQIELHLSATGEDTAAVDALLETGVQRLATALGDAVFSVDDEPLEAVVGAALTSRGWTLAAAESCTGGLLLGRMTSVPGSSAWVRGGVVAYANAVKVEQLGVSAAAIDEHGAVSEPVAITGIAGPGGGSEAKPVGTVVIAVAAPGPRTRTYRFPGDREAIRRHAVTAALDMVRRALSGRKT